MSLCINPKCELAKNQVDQRQNLFCSDCGSSLLINDIYRVLRYLGVGGFGWTALVDDGDSLKVLKVLHNTDPKAISLFDQEAEVLQRLNHSGIPKVEVGGRFNYYPKGSNIPLRCLVMEFIEGENLENYLEKRNYRPISEQAAVRWLRELVEILDLVHRANYFHRDIKPGNIMIRNTGQLALIDFGTAREETQTYLQKQQGQAVTGIISIGYTPHEQSNGQAEYRSDFFALGRTFVFLLTGKHPHEFIESLKQGLQWQEEAQLYSQALRDFINRLMCADLEDRPRNTQSVLRELSVLEASYKPTSTLSPTIALASHSLPKTSKNLVVSPSVQQNKTSLKKLLVMLGSFAVGGITITGLNLLLKTKVPSSSVPTTSEASQTNPSKTSQLPTERISESKPEHLPDPTQVVLKYYDALNRGEYQQAWNMLPFSLQNNKKIHPDGYYSFKNWFQKITPITLTNVYSAPKVAGSNIGIVNVQYSSLLNGKPLSMTVRYELVWNESNQKWEISSVKKV